METKYTCPNCGKEFMKKETAKFCKFCGHKIGQQPPGGPEQMAGAPTGQAPDASAGRTAGAPTGQISDASAGQVPDAQAQTKQLQSQPQQRPPVMPVPRAGGNIPPQKQPKKKGGLIAAVLVVVILLVLVVAGTSIFLNKMGILDLSFFTGGSGGEGAAVAESGETAAEMEAAESGVADGEAAEELIRQAEEIFEENKEKVLDDQLRSDAQEALREAVELYKQAGSSEELQPEALAGIRDIISYYEKGVQSQVDMLMAQEVSADIYKEIVRNLDEALAYGQSLVDAGFDVSMKNVTELRSNIEDRYKALYIEKFNGFIDEYNWNVRANEEFARGAYEIFPSDDPDDPIRLRYAYAKAWLVHQEIVEGMADGSLDAHGAVEKVVASLEETDYCEFLLAEAENYARMSPHVNSDYFTALNKSPIIADSSSREYTVDEIAALGLTAAQLRYARIEIYARHGMGCWDTGVSSTLGSSGEIDMYKFMSYNDFGIYSTDNTNGLTVTERHNIRAIAQAEIQNAGSGYFMTYGVQDL